MTFRARLKRLEAAVRRALPAEDHADWLTEEDWLVQFEALGRAGFFATEPDFPSALAEYRAALEAAKARPDPPFDPPAHFMPNLGDLPHLRVLNWRNQYRFPELHTGWDWLSEMFGRVRDGISPVTEDEFRALAGWFEANADLLYERSRCTGLLEVGDGRQTTTANLRYQLRQGPRARGARQLAEDFRHLRARYGGGAV
jgi:hypothetical protein